MERTREAEIDRQSKRDHGIQSKTEGGRQRHVNGERKVQFSIMTFFRVENNLSSESRKGRRRFDRTTTRQRRDVTTTIEGRFFDRNVSNGLNVFLKKQAYFLFIFVF